MSLFNLPAGLIKPTALTLNILVSSFTSWRYIRKKFFDPYLLLPLCLGAIPMAFLGGYLQLPVHLFKIILGIILILSGVRFVINPKFREDGQVKRPNLYLSIITGSLIGFLAGLTGTGGGIFLSPLILFLGWTTVRGASGTASVFILVNSISGLLGNLSAISNIPSTLPLFASAVLLGALIGTKFGVQYFSNSTIKRALGLVLVIAGVKLTLQL